MKLELNEILKFRKVRLDHLFTFNSLIETKSFSESASLLSKTQGTISQHLKELEEILNCTLIDRTSKKFAITPYGQILFESIQKIFINIEEMQEKIQKLSGEFHKIIKLTTSSIPGEYILPKMFIEFKKKKQNVDFNIQILNSEETLRKILDGSVKFGAIGSFFETNLDNFDIIRMGIDEIIILARNGHPIHQELKEVEKDFIEQKNTYKTYFSKYSWILREPGSATRTFFLKNFPFASQIKISMEIQNDVAILNTLENSDSLSVLSSYTYNQFGSSDRVKPVKWNQISPMKREFYFIKLKETTLDENEQIFWDFIQKKYTKKKI